MSRLSWGLTCSGLLSVGLFWGCSNSTNLPAEGDLPTASPSAIVASAEPTATSLPTNLPTALPSAAASSDFWTDNTPPTYGEVFKITYRSCLPCHNRYTLPRVIERVKNASFSDIDGDTRLRILAELEGLHDLMTASPPYSFTLGQETLQQFFKVVPGGVYNMLSKGAMPPPWAPKLMQAIDWPNYTTLSYENRVELLRYARPYSEKYIPVYTLPSPAPTPTSTPEPLPEAAQLLLEARMHFKTLSAPEPEAAAQPQAQLGKMLFFDPRLSQAGTISCSSCHNLASYGVDNRPVSIGHNFQRGTRNAPTVLNAALNFAQFWDGRAKNLAEQAKQPILNPIEMAMPNEAAVVQRLKSIPGYVQAFKEAFPEQAEPLSYANMAEAIARFEETLSTPSRFDRYLEGDQDSLSGNAKKGLRQFIQRGCIACHDGPGLGGRTYELLGVAEAYSDQADLGRFEVTHAERDKWLFKVPLLRNIAKTYPYFHDGKVWDLSEAIRIMGKTQLGQTFSDEEVGQLRAFLESLTGEIPEAAKTLPELPASAATAVQPET